MRELPQLKVESFTVSHALDFYINGRKSNHLVSMSFKHEPCSIEEAKVLQIKGSEIVTIAVIHDALTRGSIQIDEARDLIEDAKARHQGLADKLTQKLNLDV